MSPSKEEARTRRKARIRAKISGTEARPRLSVYKSISNNYARLINDETGKVIAEANDVKEKKKVAKMESAKTVGAAIAQKAKEHKITSVVFDRGGYKYHGRVKAIAEGAREGGLTF